MRFSHNKVLRISAAVLLAGIGCLALTKSSYAATEGTFNDNSGTTWKYSYDTDGDDPVLTIGFKTVADATNTVFSIPSLTEVKGKLSSLSNINSIDTYYIRNLTTDSEASAAVAPILTKVDMTNAAKVQIADLAPLFKNSQNTEIELVFGDDMVIGNPTDIQAGIDSNSVWYDPTSSSNKPGLFENLKVNLTNLNKVKYIGWRAFMGATLNDEDRDITIDSNQSTGGYAFANSNINSLTINAAEIQEGICWHCLDLTSLSFGDNARTIYGRAFQGDTNLRQTLDTNKLTEIGRYAFEGSGLTGLTIQSDLALIKENVFENTHLGSLDFTGSHATLGNESFKNAGINSVNFGQTLSKIRNVVFVDNNIHEVTLPKSIEELGVGIFMRNPLNKMTINFDLWDLGSEYGKWRGGGVARVIFGCANAVNSSCESLSTDDSMVNLRRLTINPAKDYNPNLMDQYTGAAEDIPDWLLENATNIIPRQFFADLDNLETLTIGEGFQYIGEQSFMRGYANQLGQSQNYCPSYAGSCNYYNWEGGRRNVKLTIPDSVISIGPKAFMWFSNNPNFTIKKLPSNLEYVGQQAFYVNAGTIKDLNTKKLRYLGSRAFAVGIRVEKAYIGDSLEYIGKEVFAGNSGYMDLTIDTDIYDGRLAASSDNGAGNFRTTFGMWITNKYLDRGYYPEGFDFNEYQERHSGTYSAVDNHRRHYKRIKFTDKNVTNPIDNSSFLEGVYCDTIDMGDAQWQILPPVSMQFVKAKELTLPHGLTKIDYNVFVAAEVNEEIVLPDTLKTIQDNAFMSNANSAKIGKVKITSLPQSLEYIGAQAFYQQDGVKLDFKNPNVKTVGHAAFFGTSVRDVVLHNGLELLVADAFFDVPTLRNVTIDINLYDQNKIQGTANYLSFAWAFNNTKNVKFGTIKLTANAGMPCDGFGNCQAQAEAAGDVCQDQDNAIIDCDRKNAYFFGINARTIDLSEIQGMTTVPTSMFQNTRVGEIILPDTVASIDEDAFFQASFGRMNTPASLEAIGDEAFQWAQGNFTAVPEGVRTIGRSAFYGADLTDDLYIPTSVESIGEDAFNAGDADVYYDTVTIAGDLNDRITNNQLVHQMLWNSDIHTLVLFGSELPSSEATKQQFWHMPMVEVVITNLPEITDRAFEGNENLTLLVMRRDANLRSIGEAAFIDCEKLHDIKFSSALANENVTLGANAFSNTGFSTIGGADAEFELDAAKFTAPNGYVFTDMKKLTSVYIPESLNSARVPEGMFANNAELTEVTVAPDVASIDDGALENDGKLSRIIFWGDATVGDSAFPDKANVYAYSGTAPATFASARSGEGKFYPLDEVLYITTDKFRITQPTSEDFNREVIVYALRRDGVVMESDNWSEFEGDSFLRSDKDLYFMYEQPTVEADPAAGTVFETPISIDSLNFDSANFSNISYEVGEADENGDRYVTISYTDGNTDKVATTSIQLRSPILPRANKTLAAAPRRLMTAPAAGATDANGTNDSDDEFDVVIPVDGVDYGRGDDEVIDENAEINNGAAAETVSEQKTAAVEKDNKVVTASASTPSNESSNPKTSDTILGYVALLASCSLLGGAAVAIIRRSKR